MLLLLLLNYFNKLIHNNIINIIIWFILDLTKNEYTFGCLQSCDISIKGKIFVKKEQVISKIHFKIYRVTSNGIEDDVVYNNPPSSLPDTQNANSQCFTHLKTY